MTPPVVISRNIFALTSAFALAAFAVGCKDEAVFVEKSRNVSSDDVKARAQNPENDGLKEKRNGAEGARNETEDAGNSKIVKSDERDSISSPGGTTDRTGGTVVKEQEGGSHGSDAGDKKNDDKKENPGDSGASNKDNDHNKNKDNTKSEIVHLDTTQKPGKVDILWVIDSSNSMSWAQTQLNSRFDSFARQLSDAKVDFRLGVTSIDACNFNLKTGAAIADSVCPDAEGISSGKDSNGNVFGPLRGEFLTDSVTGKKVLSPGADFLEAFKRIAMLGTDGSAFEHGLLSAKMAIQKSISGVNAGFLRNDANLQVIVLSDEEDDSIQMWCEDAWGNTSLDSHEKKDLSKCKTDGTSPFLDQYTPRFDGKRIPFALTGGAKGAPLTNHKFTADQFVTYMNDPSIKGAGKFRISAISSMKDEKGKVICQNAEIKNGPLESGTNYIKAAQLTGGAVQNICSTDWSQVMTKLGQNTSELASKMELVSGKIPLPGTLEVTVNGQVWDASRFEYGTQGNFLIFKVIPPADSQIHIAYKSAVN